MTIFSLFLGNDHVTASNQLKSALVLVTESNFPCGRKRNRSSAKPVKPKRKRCKAQIKVDPNKCPLCCGIFQKGEEGKWVGCDFCPRWFHKRCVSPTLVMTGKWDCQYGDTTVKDTA